jgi:hypothetical protein
VSDLASLYIKVDSSGVVTASKDLNKLEGDARKVETATAAMSSQFSKLQGVVAALAGSYALLKMGQYIQQSAMLAAKYEMLESTMRVAGNTAGYTGAQMEKVAQGMLKAGISMIASRENTMKMVIAQLDLTKATELARMAQDVARVANINSSEAFTRMIQGMRSGEVEIFKTLGIQINLEAAYRKFEVANKMATGTIQAAQKPQAIMNELLREGAKYAGLYEATLQTTAGQMLSMQRHTENLKVAFGLLFTPALAEIIKAITGNITDLNGQMTGAKKDELIAWGDNLRVAVLSAAGGLQTLAASMLTMYSVYLKIKAVTLRANYALEAPGGPRRAEADAAAADARTAEAAAAGLIEKASNNFAASGASFRKEREEAQKIIDLAEKNRLAAGGGKTSAIVDPVAIEKARKEAEKLLASWNKTMEAMNKENALAGLEGMEKALLANQIEADALRKEYEKLPLKKKAIAFAQIEENKAIKDGQAVMYDWNQERERASKTAEAGWEETRKAADAYKSLLATLTPADESSRKLAEGVETITKKFTEGTPEWQKAIDLLQKYYVALAGKDTATSAQKAADEAAKQVELYKGLAGFEDQYRQKQLDWIEKVRLAEIAAGKDKEAVNKKASDAVIKVARAEFDEKQKQIQAGLGDIASMFTSLSSLYDKSSSEYARMQELANAAIALQKVSVVINAADAVAKAATLPPPAGFVAMASMAAAMGSLLGSIGVSFGGGSGASVPSAAYGRGTTTLGGANDSGSESIGNSFKLMEDTYDLQKVTLTGIYDNMKQLNANITGIVRAVISSGIGNTTGGQISESGGSGLASILKTAGSVAQWTVIANAATMVPMFMSAGLSAMGPVGWAVLAASVADKFLGLGIMDKAVGSVTTFLLGKTSVSQGASGLEIGGGRVLPFSDVTTSSTPGAVGKLLGKHSSSNTTRNYSTDAELLAEMETLFYGPKGIVTTAIQGFHDIAPIIGGDADKAAAEIKKAFDTGFVLDFTGLKTPDEINNYITQKMSKLYDDTATILYADLVKLYRLPSEGASETITRLAVDLQSVTGILDKTGKTMTSVIPDAIALSESLIKIAGGLDKLNEAAGTYYDKFFSDADKQADRQETLLATFDKYKMVFPETRDAFKALVTAAGPEATVALWKSAGAMDEFFTYLEDAATEATRVAEEAADKAAQIASQRASLDIQILRLTGQDEAALAAERKIALDGMDASLWATQKYAWALEDVKTATEKYNDTIADLTETLNGAFSNFGSALSDYQSAVSTAASDMHRLADTYRSAT